MNRVAELKWILKKLRVIHSEIVCAQADLVGIQLSLNIKLPQVTRLNNSMNKINELFAVLYPLLNASTYLEKQIEKEKDE